jgi:hypothetical protein
LLCWLEEVEEDTMRTRRALLLVLPIAAASALAATDKVPFPEGFASGFVRYKVVDRDDRNIARFMYMNPEAWVAAEPGEPLPHGTIIVMEDHPVRMQDDETPERDADGRLIPTDETTNVFVMQKGEGWGAEYPEELRNGEWEYAWFAPDGARMDRELTGCFECHMAQAAADFTFTAFQAVEERE